MTQSRPDPPSSSELRYVSTAQVARALGVSVTTVKRWVDDGILSAHRTAGKHRKLLMSDVLRMVREKNLPQADLSSLVPPRPNIVASGDLHALRKQLIEAITRPDYELARSIIHGAYHQGYAIEQLADEVIGPAMTFIGDEWEAGRVEVLKEHRATQCVVTSLYELKGMLRTQVIQNRPVAVGGAPELDHTIIPSLMAKLVLIDAGWEAINLGPHTPISAFLSAMDDLKPKLIWLCVTHLQDPEFFLKDYAKLAHEAEVRKIPIAIGGAALSKEIRSRMTYTAFGDGLTHLARFAKALHPLPDLPKRGRPPVEKSTTTSPLPERSGEVPDASKIDMNPADNSSEQV